MTIDATKLDTLRKIYREGAQTQRSVIQAERSQRPGLRQASIDQVGRPAPQPASPVGPLPHTTVAALDRSSAPKLAELESFLTAVLPPAGPVYMAATLSRAGGWIHHACHSVSELAQRLLTLDTGAVDVYFAVAAFRQERLMVKGKMQQRCRENVVALRSARLDLDVGAKHVAAGDGYTTQAQARAALDLFCTQLEFQPSFIVSSGNGLHVYWVFSEPVGYSPWQNMADALKRACRVKGLLADEHCTADSTRVLRPPATFNRKDPKNPIPVAVVVRNEPVEFAQFTAAVSRLAGVATVGCEDECPLPLRRQSHPVDNSALGAGLHEPHPYLRGLSRDEQLALIDTACAAIPDSVWAKYSVWAETAMKGLRGLQWEDETPLIRILSRHTFESDRPTLPEKFRSWDGGSIGPLFDLAVRHGWRAAAALPAPKAETAKSSMPALPIDNEPSLERYLTDSYVLVRCRGEGEYFDLQRRLCMRPGAVNRAEGHITRSVGKSADQILRASPLTQRVDLLGFHPAAGPTYIDDEFLYVNLHCPVAEKLEPTAGEARLIADFMDYLFPLSEDQAFKLYYEQFLGHIVQRPATKIATALLFVGGFGVGKNTAAYDIPSLIVGRRNAQVISNKVLNSSFSDQLGRAHLVYLDEVHCNGNWQSQDQANNLKSLVSDRRVVVHPKGHAAYDISNRIVVTATSNYEDAMFLQTNDRRWAVHEVEPARSYTAEQHRQYFNLMHRFLTSPRAPGVLRWIFGRVGLAGFDAQNPPPMTAAKARMVEGSRSLLEDEILALFENREPPFNLDLFTLEDLRLALRLRVRSFEGTSLKRLATILRAEPIRAEKLALRPRNTRGQGKPIRPYYWALRNADAWSDASNEDILRHIQMGAPLLRPIPETPACGSDGAAEPAVAITHPTEITSPVMDVEPSRGAA